MSDFDSPEDLKTLEQNAARLLQDQMNAKDKKSRKRALADEAEEDAARAKRVAAEADAECERAELAYAHALKLVASTASTVKKSPEEPYELDQFSFENITSVDNPAAG
jgi:hypothetical protein